MTGQIWLYLLLFWGVWLLVPVVIDVANAAWRSAMRRQQPYPPLPNVGLPKVSIVIAAHNEQVNIDRCITSIKAQTYLHSLIEVIVVNDGSTDYTSDVVISHMTGMGHWKGHIRLHNQVIPVRDIGGLIDLLRGQRSGGRAALNAGLAQCGGDIIMTVGGDMVLERDAIEQAVMVFLNQPDMMAAAAHLIIDHHLLVEADEHAKFTCYEEGRLVLKRLDLIERALVACQFLEYVTVLHVGRQVESATETIFTLSGGCAIFRAEALDETDGYRRQTDPEDTDAALGLHRHSWRIGYLPQVHVRLAPVTSWIRLYSQRVRWQRGELEVVGVNADRLYKGPTQQNLLWGWACSRLQKDHSLTLPRLIWPSLIFVLVFFGYPFSIIVQALGAMYLLYVAAEMAQAIVAYAASRDAERQLIRISLPYIVLMPLYRVAAFWFRMSGVMLTFSETPTWNVRCRKQEHSWLAQALGTLRGWTRRLITFWAH